MTYLNSFMLAKNNQLDCIEKPVTGNQEISQETVKLIKNADKEILFQFYKFHPDSDSGQDILNALKILNEKARTKNKKITIKFLINHREGLAAAFTSKYQKPIPAIKKTIETLGLSNLSFEYATHSHGLFACYHTKQIIVDGKKGMLRSGDVTHQHNYKKGALGQKEIVTLVNGQLAEAMKADFDKSWQAVKNKQIFRKKEKLPPDYFSNKAWALLLTQNSSNDILRRHPSSFKKALITEINAAKISINILTPNLNDPDIIQALCKACNRKVKVNIVMGKYHNQKGESYSIMGGTNIDTAIKMFKTIDLGKEQYLQIHWATDKNKKVVQDRAPGTLHAKLLLIDEKLVFTGSSPLDLQSMYHSKETNLVFHSSEKAKPYTEIFNHIFKNESISIAEDQFKKYQSVMKSKIQKIISRLEKDKQSLKNKHFYLFKMDNEKLTIKMNRTNDKIKKLNNLNNDIDKATSKKEIDNLLLKASKIQKDNPLALERSKKGEKYGKTKTIRQIQNLRY